jgi:hypothetical protein
MDATYIIKTWFSIFTATPPVHGFICVFLIEVLHEIASPSQLCFVNGFRALIGGKYPATKWIMERMSALKYMFLPILMIVLIMSRGGLNFTHML